MTLASVIKSGRGIFHSNLNGSLYSLIMLLYTHIPSFPSEHGIFALKNPNKQKSHEESGEKNRAR